jgi:hypothetical protein
MSDYAIEESKETGRSLLKNSIYFWIGWILFVIGIGTHSLTGYGMFSISNILMLVGWGVIGFPKIKLVLKAGFGSIFASPLTEYEVVTKDASGRVVSSDGGMESFSMNLFARALLIAVVYVIGAFITVIQLLILSVKCLIKRISIPIVIANVAVFFSAFIITGIIYNVGTYQTVAAESGTTATVITANAEMFPDLGPLSEAIKVFPKGEVVTIIGVNKRFPDWTQIKHEGKKGWIETKDIQTSE